jgi:hypothetical protein
MGKENKEKIIKRPTKKSIIIYFALSRQTCRKAGV